jgi:membrane protease YdiL (CAAX protease family)
LIYCYSLEVKLIPKTTEKISLSLIFLASGFAVFVFGSPYYSIFPTNNNRVYYIGLTLFFLCLSLFFKSNKRFSTYWPVTFSFFMASFATLFLNLSLLNIPASTTNPSRLIALDKLSQFIQVVFPIIFLVFLGKIDFKSIFLAKGNVKEGITFGLISFLIFSILALVLYSQSSDFFNQLPAHLPWLLLFIFANSIMEEIWFRGIFLERLEKLVGTTAAIIITAIVFGASHISATYSFPGGGAVFGLVVFIMGLILAYTMRKFGIIIGPILFHAGMDLLIILPVIASVK